MIIASWSLFCALAYGAAGPVSLSYTVEAPGDLGHVVTAGGVRVQGPDPLPGQELTLSNTVLLSETGDTVLVALELFDAQGALAPCPLVRVPVKGEQPECEPTFIVTQPRLGYRSFACRSSCELPRGARERTARARARGWGPYLPALP